jgi:hypothetical protein
MYARVYLGVEGLLPRPERLEGRRVAADKAPQDSEAQRVGDKLRGHRTRPGLAAASSTVVGARSKAARSLQREAGHRD